MTDRHPPRPDATPEAWHGAPLPTRCATCGGEPQVIRTRSRRIEGYRVACEACAVGTNWHPTRERAVTSWNVGRDEPAPTPPPPLPPGSPPSRWPMRVFLASAALTLGLATCALADDAPCAETAALPGAVEWPLSPSPYADTVTLAPHPVHVAAVCYHNNANRGSAPGPFVVSGGGVSVEIMVEVGADAPETVTVIPPEGFVALPSDVQTVPDGGAVTFFIEEVKV